MKPTSTPGQRGGLWRDLSDLLLGVRCLGCGTGGLWWCPQCVQGAWRPGRSVGLAGETVISAATYEGAVRQALVAHKERGQLALATPMGTLLARAIAEHGGHDDCVLVPAPSTARARRRRGHDHIRRVAEAAGREIRQSGRPAQVISALRVSRPVADQAGLSATGRRDNVAGAFVADRSRPDGRPVLIVDDITTTGATLAEASRALRDAGWSVRGATVVARTDPWTGVAAHRRLG